jgi:hypothetical protein
MSNSYGSYERSEMKALKPIPFNPENDLPPIPFESRHVGLARELKRLGLPWVPHVGCFVWDEEGVIEALSPFPERFYFILSLPRFLNIFVSIEAMREKLVWLPTWHQSRLLCRRLGLEEAAIVAIWNSGVPMSPGDELQAIYEELAAALRR